MRILFLTLCLAATPALAQTAERDSAASPPFALSAHTAFVAAGGGVPTGYVGFTGAYEIAPETAATFSVAGGDLGPDRAVFVSFGPGLTHTRALGGHSEAAAAVGVRVTGSQARGGNVPYRGTRAFGVAGVDRAFRVVGSVEVVPTLGAYAAAGHWAEEVNVYGDSLGGAFTSAGLLAGARVRFAAFGQTFELPLLVPVEVFGRGSSRLPAYAEQFGSRVTYREVKAQFDANPSPLLARL